MWQGNADIARLVIGCRSTEEMRFPGITRHVIGCRLTQEKRVQSGLADVASSICKALGCGSGEGHADSSRVPEVNRGYVNVSK